MTGKQLYFMGYISSQTLRSIAPAMRLERSRQSPGLHGSPSDANGSRECAPLTSASARGDDRLRIVRRRRTTWSVDQRRCEARASWSHASTYLKGSKSCLASRCLAEPVVHWKPPLPGHRAHGLTSCRLDQDATDPCAT